MTRSIPQVRNGFLHDPPGAAGIPVGTAAWYDWLENHRSFSYEIAGGTMTVRKEARPGGWYWYAYRRKQGKLQKIYLGGSHCVTNERLHMAAQLLDTSSLANAEKYQKATSSGDISQQDILLSTKLTPPTLRPDLVPRCHLIRKLDEAVARKLTLISAPAGSGKTTLLGEWESHRRQLSDQRLPIAWLSLDERDNDPAFFWLHAISALQTLHAGLGDNARALLLSTQPASLEQVLTALINALNAFSDHLVLVLDDYHCITSEALHNSFTFFLDHMPVHLHLIIASRTQPPFALARLRSHDELVELNTHDLRFTYEEASTFLQHTMKLSLSDEAIGMLEMRTEGWIAGLQIAALSLRSQQGMAACIASFTGGHRHMLDYLSEEVISCQSEAVQNFLLHTCILERMNSSLCDALLAKTDPSTVTGQGSRELLLALEQKNLFIISLDEQRTWYRYHQLFADALRSYLQHHCPALIPLLHQRASRWFELNGLGREAIDHALFASDVERAATLIGQHTSANIWRYSELGALRRWFDALPPTAIRARPSLCLLQAWIILSCIGTQTTDAATLQHRLETMASLIHEAQQRLPADQSSLSALRLQGEIAAFSAFVSFFRGEYQQVKAHAQRAFALLPRENTTLRSLAARMLCLAFMQCWDGTMASSALQEFTVISQSNADAHAAANALFYVADAHFVQGRLQQSFASHQQAVQLAEDILKMESMAVAHKVGLAAILLEWNDLAAAARYLLPGVKYLEQHREIDPGILISSYHTLIELHLAERNIEEAFAIIDAEEVLLRQYPQFPQSLMEAAIARRVRLRLVCGDIAAATNWVFACEPLRDEEFRPANVTKLLILARVYLATKKAPAAAQLLKQLFQMLKQGRHIHFMIQTLVLQTLTFSALGDTRRAVGSLTCALSLAEPGGYVRSFLNEGTPLTKLLSQLPAMRTKGNRSGTPLPSVEYVQKLLQAAKVPIPSQPLLAQPTKEQTISQQTSSSILSARELEIIYLMGQGFSDSEIAQQLTLAPTTVKTHARRIYARLDVKNRAHAVMRARELSIL